MRSPSLLCGKMEQATGTKNLNKLFHILIRSALLHATCFICFSVYCMRDGSTACITSVINLLVTGKNKYKINALMEKASYDNI